MSVKTWFTNARHKFQMESPIGRLTLVSSPKGLKAVLTEADLKNDVVQRELSQLASKSDGFVDEANNQLSQYFSRRRRDFDLMLDVDGTPFQKKAWAALCMIPYGTTKYYSEQAESLGDSRKARAVGSANGQNPLSVVVPCHRVIAKSGNLGGYRSGLKIKRFLLELEGRKITK